MTEEILWTSGFFNERFPAPISPLGWSVLQPLIEELALRDPLRFLGYPEAETIPLTRLWRGHPYANVRAFQIFYKVFPDVLLPEDAYRYFPNGEVALRKRAPYPRWRDAPRVIFSLLRAVVSDPFNVSPFNNYRHWAHYARLHDERVTALRARLNELQRAEPHAIFGALRQVEKIHRDFLRIHRWSLMDADLAYGLLKRWVGGERAARLVADVPNKTMEVDRDVGRLTLSEFLSKHGHRSFSLDIAVPTFAEDPTQVERLIQTMNQQRRTTEEMSGQRSVASAWSFWQRIMIAPGLSLARRYTGMREDQRYDWQKALALSRQLYLLFADRLLADGVISERHAVFYATHQELADYFDCKLPKNDLAQKIVARQTEWREYQREFEQAPSEAYPPFLYGDVPLSMTGQPQDLPRHYSPSPFLSDVGVREWHGRAISPGIARGRVRVVHSAEELVRVQAGDILVAPATDPAWTPVFGQIAGLVVERGGVLSHSAVIAREYHLPAVAGIPNIVAAMHDGDIIEVDGTRGVVRDVQKT